MFVLTKITQGKPFVLDENCELFSFLAPYENDSIFNMSQGNLEIFLAYLKSFLLSLRESLNFDNFVTFGLELEFEHADMSRIRYDLARHGFIEDWECDFDDPNLGVMEVRSPVLLNSSDNWLQLHKITNIISKNAKVGKYCGSHVHVGAHILGDDPLFWYYFLLVWDVYEHVIFRHCYGEKEHARPKIRKHAKSMKSILENVLYYFFQNSTWDLSFLLFLLSDDRYQAVNLKNVSPEALSSYNYSNTIEFRNPNGTLNPVIWQNNVNLFVHILKYVRSERFDLEKVKWRKKQDIFLPLEQYENIFLDDALEFCDMIFPTNLDKIYFLKQYLKDDFKIYQSIPRQLAK